jgi:hypothetical protein
MPEKPDRKPDPELQNDVFVKEVRPRPKARFRPRKAPARSTRSLSKRRAP